MGIQLRSQFYTSDELLRLRQQKIPSDEKTATPAKDTSDKKTAAPAKNTSDGKRA
jgi:hypothetical protein